MRRLQLGSNSRRCRLLFPLALSYFASARPQSFSRTAPFLIQWPRRRGRPLTLARSVHEHPPCSTPTAFDGAPPPLARAGATQVLMYDDDDGFGDADGDGIADEVEDVIEVLWEHHDLCFQLFLHYAALRGSCDSICLNEWTQFTLDLGLVRKGAGVGSRAHLDQVFIQMNAMTQKAKRQGVSTAVDDTRNEMNRIEFYAALIRLAIGLYVIPRHESDVSDALHRLISHDLLSRGLACGTRIFVDANHFRVEHCYTRECDAALHAHEASLRRLFHVLSHQDDSMKPKSLKGLLSLEEWDHFVRGAGLVGADLSRRDAIMCFSWARMAVVDSRSRIGHEKSVSLPFEGFLEALCRVACLKIYPSEEELDAAGSPGQCGDFFRRLAAGDIDPAVMTPKQWKQLLRQRKLPWGAEPSRPIAESLRHLLTLVFESVEQLTGGKDDKDITAKEAAEWASKICKRSS